VHPYFLVLMQPVHQKHGPGSMIIAFVNTIKCSPYSFTASCSLVVSCFTSLELQYLSLNCVHKLFPITVPLQVQFIVLYGYKISNPRESLCLISKVVYSCKNRDQCYITSNKIVVYHYNSKY